MASMTLPLTKYSLREAAKNVFCKAFTSPLARGKGLGMRFNSKCKETMFRIRIMNVSLFAV